MVVLDKFQIHTFLAMIVIVLLLFSFASDPLALSSASEPSAFGSLKSAISAPNSSDSCQLRVSIS